MNHIWNKSDIDFLIKNYPTKGTLFCANHLNIDLNKVKSKVQRMKLNLEDKTDVNLFLNINKKEVAYVLGLIWADGNINNNNKNYYISLESISDDLLLIENTIMQTGNWKKYERKGRMRNNTICKNSICYRIGFKKLYELFKNYDYHIKSKTSPNKILKNIPDYLKHYFYRGIIDGDGCFYINKKNHNYQFILSSSIEQDWNYMENLSIYLKINKYSIKRQLTKRGNYSQFKITNKSDILKLGNYIYQNYDNIGLERKFNKYQDIIRTN